MPNQPHQQPLNHEQPQSLADLAQLIKQWGRELGFQQVGITDADLSEEEPRLQAWLDKGYHGDMDWMADHGNKRSRPEELLPGTLRVISVRLDYLPADTEQIKVLKNPEQAYVSRYTLGRDYHKLIRKRLSQLAKRIEAAADSLNDWPVDNPNSGAVTSPSPERRVSDEKPSGSEPASDSVKGSREPSDSAKKISQRAFVDSAPVMERPLAAKAGLGWVGKHTLVINSEAGSWFFLGEVYTNLPLPVDKSTETNQCGDCKACLQVCPTDAFTQPYELDARRCISYLTIENKGSIPEKFREPMGNRVFGCDDCQAICPWNKFASFSCEDDFQPRHALDKARLVDLFAWTEEQYLKNTEGSAIRRIGFEAWLRNLAVGLGNATTTPKVIESLKARANYPSELVQEHVNWALRQHENPNRRRKRKIKAKRD